MRTKEIIDAFAEGLNGLALPTHATYKYFRPLSLAGPTGARVPALAVSPAVDQPELIQTPADYEVKSRLLVTWYAGQMNAMQVGAVEEAMAGGTLDLVGVMTELFISWAEGIPTLDFQTEVTLGDVHYGAIEGGIWASEMNVTVKYWTP